jgi:hypothetical protein
MLKSLSCLFEKGEYVAVMLQPKIWTDSNGWPHNRRNDVLLMRAESAFTRASFEITTLLPGGDTVLTNTMTCVCLDQR